MVTSLYYSSYLFAFKSDVLVVYVWIRSLISVLKLYFVSMPVWPMSNRQTLLGWLVVLRINVDLAIFQPYLDLEAGDNQSLKIQVARPGIEPRSSCSASQELNHSATTAPADITKWWFDTISIHISRICYGLDSRSNVNSQGHREYMMKFFIPRSVACTNTNRTNLQDNETTQRNHQNIEYRTITVNKPPYKYQGDTTLSNKRPKGPHIVHLSTMCHLFGGFRSARKTQTW